MFLTIFTAFAGLIFATYVALRAPLIGVSMLGLIGICSIGFWLKLLGA